MNKQRPFKHNERNLTARQPIIHSQVLPATARQKQALKTGADPSLAHTLEIEMKAKTKLMFSKDYLNKYHC